MSLFSASESHPACFLFESRPAFTLAEELHPASLLHPATSRLDELQIRSHLKLETSLRCTSSGANGTSTSSPLFAAFRQPALPQLLPSDRVCFSVASESVLVSLCRADWRRRRCFPGTIPAPRASIFPRVELSASAGSRWSKITVTARQSAHAGGAAGCSICDQITRDLNLLSYLPV